MRARLHQLEHVPQAKAAPQLLILAEPLLREGLVRLLEPGFQAAVDPEGLSGSVRLVIWSAAGNLPLATLQRELHQLRDRWQPAPVLLLVPGDGHYSSDQLLQLPCEGLLQQAEPAEIPDAVNTLLAGGRVVELRPLAVEQPEPEAIGLGQWLLRSGLSQIDTEQQRCYHWLQQGCGGLTRLLLHGRLRELAAARRVLLWLWGPISMAFPQTAATSQPTPRSTAITVRQRTAEGVWQAIQLRLTAAIDSGLSNSSGQLLALDGLNPEHRRDLLLALLSQLDLLITRLRHEQLRGEDLEQRWLQQQPELRRLSLRRIAGEYVQLPQQGGLLPVAESLSNASELNAIDPDLPLALPMLSALVQAQPLLVEGRLLAPDEPQALLHLELLIGNWLIRSAELISAEILSCCSTWPELRRYLLRPDLLATRNLERLRNQLNSQQRWDNLFERPVQLYESRRLLYGIQNGAITPQLLTEPRDSELRQLSWSQQLITLSLEARDALAPQLQSVIRRLGDLVVVVLTQVIGRAIGLVGKGVLQGMGRSISRS
ncbi:MAG: DUF3685 domain-containing protein [Cyanobacteria bacterium K_DeepCast_150m_m2_101]|nr:DUF3685 domain-containing protein [Cyanobacteria bacterium K_DeepCast_150m_m2_101]